MSYKILADITVIIHFLWILFLIFGVFLGLRNKTVRIIHLSGLAFALLIQVFNWYCPLTYLEAWLRAQHDPRLSYTRSFIIHYMEKFVYLELPRGVVFMLSIALCAVTAWLYLRKKKR